jgi:D-glycero-D-manno-heptose 1,7-bisphosphate phosphatase
MAKQAIFLDRDGVINRERSDYVKAWSEFEFLPGALSALRDLSMLDLPIIVLTNQSVIGRGIVSQATVEMIHQCANTQITQAGGRVDAFFLCPHHPDEQCLCRKPKPGLLLQAAAAFALHLSECIFIGDSITDALAAQAGGCQSLLVASGRQGQQLPELLVKHDLAVPIVTDLVQAVSLIKANYVR